MACIYLISGPCGCGKTTLSKALAAHLAQEKQVYLIHGDSFHAGFIGERQGIGWPEMLRFNWECILTVAAKALARGLDVVIDYVVEEELPLVSRLAREHGAALYYLVLTASGEVLRERLAARGDGQLTDRALFLREKLAEMPENQGRLVDATDRTPEQILASLDMARFLCPLVTTDIDNPAGDGVS